MTDRYDAIVVGVGGVGSAATYHLAARGQSVLGIERFDVPHARGSSHGSTRIIRRVQHEGAAYVPLVERAYELWRDLERETGRELLHVTGSVHAGPPAAGVVGDAREACEAGDIPHETLSAAEVNERFPGYDLPESFRAVYQPDGGFLACEQCTVAHVEAAHAAGATVRAREQVLDWSETRDGVRVRTDKGRYAADELVVTAGPWTGKLLPELAPETVPVRAVMAWLQPERPALFQPDRFPVFVVREGDREGGLGVGGGGYGFPVHDRPGFKLGLGDPQPVVDPDAMDREPTRAEERLHREFAERYFPAGAGPTVGLTTCLWSMSEDEHFLLGRPDGYDSVTVGAGFSGHGYKFASVTGEVLADLATEGTTDHDIGIFDVNRV
jgi:sarcosine oxidase